MKRFKNILLFADGEERSGLALERAVALAIRNEGRLTVAGVVQELPRDLQRLAAGMPLEGLQAMATQGLRERLERMVAPFRQEGAPLSLEVFCGKPFLEIIRAVERRQHDLVMLPAEGTTGLKTAFFGSTSLHLLRKCPCPVWVMKPSGEARYARILAAVDPDPLDVVRDGVNTEVMELATSLARLEGSELHVAHAWEDGDQTGLRGWQARVSEAQAAEWAAQAREARQRRFDELLARFDLNQLKLHAHLEQGEASDVIARLVDQERIDLIVMGTLARTGIAGYFIGNTAETVLQRVACPVLTVKPQGFVSPVRSE